MRVGDKVRLRDSYEGYFASEKGKVLTIKEAYTHYEWEGYGDDTNTAFIVVEEFDESHGLHIRSFEKVGE